MTLPVAGYYPDPEDGSRLRWWDGTRWGAVMPVPAAPSAPVVGPTPRGADVRAPQWVAAPRPPAPSEYRPVGVDATPLRGRRAHVERDRQTRAANPFGYAGLALAIVALLFNLFAVPSILAVVFGAIGLSRAGQLTGHRVTGFGVSLAAVILGLVSGALFVVRFAQLLA